MKGRDIQATREEIKEIFDYHEDGFFLWKVRNSNRIKIGDKVGGKPGQNGYLYTYVSKKKYLVHRLVFFWHHGWVPEQLDHHDRDRTNNRIANLRPADDSQNQSNRGMHPKNTSGFRGVSWSYRAGKWAAKIRFQGKQYHLGVFANPEDASKIYELKAQELRGEFFHHLRGGERP
jgi:hypothetical protein